jgi:hypothetical protein
MKIKIFLIMTICFFVSSNMFSIDATSDKVSYENEKITYQVNKYFDSLYPGDMKDFVIFQGKKRITKTQFIVLSNDELLLTNQQYIHKTQLAGFISAGILGGATVSFFIPSVVFFWVHTQYYKTQSNYNVLGYSSWLDFFQAKYSEYFIPGFVCMLLSAVSLVALIVDLTVTFALLYKYQNNENLVRDAIERYNEKLREKYNILPDINSESNDVIKLGLKMNL